MIKKVTRILKKLNCILEDSKRRMGTDIDDKHLSMMSQYADKYYKKASNADNEFDAQYWLNMLKYNRPDIARGAAIDYFSKELNSNTVNFIDNEEEFKELSTLPNYSVSVKKTPEDIIETNDLVKMLYKKILPNNKKEFIMLMTYWLIKSKVANDLKVKLPYEKETLKMMNEIDQEDNNSLSDVNVLKKLKISQHTWYKVKDKLKKFLKDRSKI